MSIFSLFHLLLSGDGSADRRHFQRQRLWPQWVFIFSCLSYHLIFRVCDGDLFLIFLVSQWKIFDVRFVLFRRFLCWNCQKGYSCVQGQQHRLDKCFFSTKYRYYVCRRGGCDIADSCKSEFVLHFRLWCACSRPRLCLTWNDPILSNRNTACVYTEWLCRIKCSACWTIFVALDSCQQGFICQITDSFDCITVRTEVDWSINQHFWILLWSGFMPGLYILSRSRNS